MKYISNMNTSLMRNIVLAGFVACIASFGVYSFLYNHIAPPDYCVVLNPLIANATLEKIGSRPVDTLCDPVGTFDWFSIIFLSVIMFIVAFVIAFLTLIDMTSHYQISTLRKFILPYVAGIGSAIVFGLMALIMHGRFVADTICTTARSHDFAMITNSTPVEIAQSCLRDDAYYSLVIVAPMVAFIIFGMIAIHYVDKSQPSN